MAEKEKVVVRPYEFDGRSPECADRRFFTTEFGIFAHAARMPRNQEEHRCLRDAAIRRLRLSAGLEPGIDFLPLKPQVTSPRVIDGVTVYDVEIATLPGLKLTGNFFTPARFSGKLPAILCPHGHWRNGRVHHAPNGGVIMRCMEFARLGFAVFAWDMVGYNDCNEIPHRWEYDDRRRGYFNGISPFGLQTANSLRAVDFIVSRPEVDPARIGCTGASGGGSQTWFISLLDTRIKAICPVCMLSAHFMGGCTCEEGPLLRVRGLTSLDIVAGLAPRPLLLPGVTGDWTNLNPDYEVPRLKEIYGLYHAEDKLEYFYYDDRHNYNRRTREHVYAWFVRQLQGREVPETLPESGIEPPPPEKLWHGGVRPDPPSKESFGKAFRRLRKCYTGKALEFGNDFTTWQNSRCDILRQMLESDLPTRDVVERVTHGDWQLPGGEAWARVISRRGTGEMIPAMRLRPERAAGSETAFLLPVEDAVMEYFNDGPRSSVTKKLFKLKGHTLLFELAGSGSRAVQLEHALRDDGHSLDAACNDSYFAMRVQDIVTCVVLARERKYKDITLVGLPVNAPAVLAAAALTGVKAVVDLSGVTEKCWEEKFNYQALMGKLGGLAGLALLDVRPGVVFCRASDELKQVLKPVGGRLSEKTPLELLK